MIREQKDAKAVERAMASKKTAKKTDKKTVAVVLFGGFELLDVAAPVEFFGALGSSVLELCYCRLPDSPAATSAVSSSCLELRGGSSGPDFVTTHVLSDKGTITSTSDGTRFHPNIVFVPGGTGVRSQLENKWLSAWFVDACDSPSCEIVFTVCTGSWLLGVSGFLDGLSATCNKAAMRDKSSGPLHSCPKVKWVDQARWVEDRSPRRGGVPLVVTSSGVSAGGDAALAVIAELRGRERAREVATQCEWIWQEDPTNDPFSQSTPVKAKRKKQKVKGGAGGSDLGRERE